MDEEMVLAAKAKDKIRLSALRMLKSGLHNREIDLKRGIGEAEFLQLLSSMVNSGRIPSNSLPRAAGRSRGKEAANSR